MRGTASLLLSLLKGKRECCGRQTEAFGRIGTGWLFCRYFSSHRCVYFCMLRIGVAERCKFHTTRHFHCAGDCWLSCVGRRVGFGAACDAAFKRSSFAVRGWRGNKGSCRTKPYCGGGGSSTRAYMRLCLFASSAYGSICFGDWHHNSDCSRSCCPLGGVWFSIAGDVALRVCAFAYWCFSPLE